MREYIDAIVWFAKDIAEGYRNARKQRDLDRQIRESRKALREEASEWERTPFTDANISWAIHGPTPGELYGDREAA